MFERIRVRGIVGDDTRDIRNQYVGLLSERLATMRLKLAATTDPAEHRRLRVAIAGLEQAIDQARNPKESNR